MFNSVSKYKPNWDQQQATEKLVEVIKNNEKHQVVNFICINSCIKRK